MTVRVFRIEEDAEEITYQGRQYVRLCPVEAVPPGTAAVVHVDGEDVALFHCHEGVFALGNRCAHQHVSVLADGVLEGLSVRCPRHGWRYDLRTGKAVEGSGCVPVYGVLPQGGWFYVERPTQSWQWS